MKRAVILIFLLMLTGCESVCFKETPTVIQNNTGSITKYHMEGNWIVTSCNKIKEETQNGEKETIKEKGKEVKSVESVSDHIECTDSTGKVWACPTGSICEETKLDDGFVLVKCIQ